MSVQPVVAVQAQPQTVVVVQGGGGGADASADSCAKTMFILGFFFPLLWLINGCMHACHKSPTAKCFGKASLILGLLEVVIVIILIVVMVMFVGAVVSAATDGGLNALSSGFSDAMMQSQENQAKCTAVQVERDCAAFSVCEWSVAWDRCSAK